MRGWNGPCSFSRSAQACARWRAARLAGGDQPAHGAGIARPPRRRTGPFWLGLISPSTPRALCSGFWLLTPPPWTPAAQRGTGSLDRMLCPEYSEFTLRGLPPLLSEKAARAIETQILATQRRQLNGTDAVFRSARPTRMTVSVPGSYALACIKLRTICLPSFVRMLSGWNWTPQIG